MSFAGLATSLVSLGGVMLFDSLVYRYLTTPTTTYEVNTTTGEQHENCGEMHLLIAEIVGHGAAQRLLRGQSVAKRQILTVDQTQVMPRSPLPQGGCETTYA